MDKAMLKIYDDSLRRCNARAGFLTRFYELFLASSPEVQARFANTDLEQQKRALRASLHMMGLAAADPVHYPARYLRDIAASHCKKNLDVGAHLYDLWLDSLLATVRESDPEFGPEVEKAWEGVMMVGISYMLTHYNEPPAHSLGK